MNERIKELAEQAGGHVSLSYEHGGKLILSGEDIVKKFAELIVQECIDYCGENLSKTVGGALKLHFGVERMSEVELFYAGMKARWPHPLPEWNDLAPERQHLILSGINLILQGIS